MQAGLEQFVVIIKAGFFWVEKDKVFLESAEPAEVGGVIEGCCPL